jgi:hypothetical protein
MSKELDMLAVENCVCFNLRWLTRAVTQFYDECGGTAFVPRGNLASNSGQLEHGELSDWLGMERTTLVLNLRPLQQDGFVEAAGSGRGNRVELTITAKAKTD